MVGLLMEITVEVIVYVPTLNVVNTKLLTHVLENSWNCICVAWLHQDYELPVEPWNQSMCLCWIISKKVQKIFTKSLAIKSFMGTHL